MLRDFTRVSIFLPLTGKSAPRINYMIKTLQETFGGVTFNRPTFPTAFVGRYVQKGKNNGKTKIYTDHIVWFIIDIDNAERIDIDKYFTNFKTINEKELGEEEIWIVCNQVSRFVEEGQGG